MRATVLKILDATRQGDRLSLSKMLQAMAAEPDHRCPPAFLHRTATALQTGDWSGVADDFVAKTFIGESGDFLLLGDYIVRRQAGESKELTVVYGRVQPGARPDRIRAAVERLFDSLHQPVPEVLAIDVFAACGAVGGERGEAFLVPDGWTFGPEVLDGPALNDMREQRRRFEASGDECITRIFEKRDADLLLGVMRPTPSGDVVRDLEYALHDAGHGAGLGLQTKLAENLLQTSYQRGVEEWRADGVAFSLALDLLDPSMAAAVVASNLCTRLGVDAHRRGGIDADTDVDSALLTFEFMTRFDQLTIGPTGRLAFAKEGPQGLLRAVELHRAEAVALTRREMRLDNRAGLAWLYSAIPVAHQTRALFEDKVLRPCRGLYTELR